MFFILPMWLCKENIVLHFVSVELEFKIRCHLIGFSKRMKLSQPKYDQSVQRTNKAAIANLF